MVNWKDTNGTITWDGNTAGTSPRLNTPFWIGAGAYVSPTGIRSQDIESPRGSIVLQDVRNAQPFDSSINRISTKHRDPAPTLSKGIGGKLSKKSSADIYSIYWMNFTHDAVLTKSPNFTNLGLASVHTPDELGSFSIPINRIGSCIDESNWITTGHIIGEVTADRMSRTRPEQNYSSKTDFETRRENQDFERQNNSTSRPPLDSTTLGTNTTNGTMSPIVSLTTGTTIP